MIGSLSHDLRVAFTPPRWFFSPPLPSTATARKVLPDKTGGSLRSLSGLVSMPFLGGVIFQQETDSKQKKIITFFQRCFGPRPPGRIFRFGGLKLKHSRATVPKQNGFASQFFKQSGGNLKEFFPTSKQATLYETNMFLIRYLKNLILLLMEEILHQLIGSLSHY